MLQNNFAAQPVSELDLEELQKQCRYLSAIVNESFDGLCVTDSHGNLLFHNSAYTELSGVSLQEVQGKNALEYEAAYIEKAVTPIAMAEKRAVTMMQTMLRTGRKVLVTSRPVFDAQGEISFFILNIRDITELERLKRSLSRAEHQACTYLGRLHQLRELLSAKTTMIANDAKMIDVLSMAKRVAKTDSSVLLTGETGVGKEEVAKYIHENSGRSEQMCITVNCGAIPPTLIESELFGYEAGAFTGARAKGKVGLFEVANKSTLFLDELGELPMDMQVKLLRVLQSQEITRVGGTHPVKIDVRIIAATNRDLLKMVEAGTFRADLYYRISVIPIPIPPLRERKHDIIPLAERFLAEFNSKYGESKRISEQAQQAMVEYQWPGNVRELRNVVERAFILSSTMALEPEDFPFAQTDIHKTVIPENGTVLSELLCQIEYSYLESAYRKCGNGREAAALLGMKHSTFASRLKMLRQKFQPDSSLDTP